MSFVYAAGWHLQCGADLRRSACCFVGSDHLWEIGQFGCNAWVWCLGQKKKHLVVVGNMLFHVDATWMMLYLCLWYIMFLPLFCVTYVSLFILILFLMVIFQTTLTDLPLGFRINLYIHLFLTYKTYACTHSHLYQSCILRITKFNIQKAHCGKSIISWVIVCFFFLPAHVENLQFPYCRG